MQINKSRKIINSKLKILFLSNIHEMIENYFNSLSDEVIDDFLLKYTDNLQAKLIDISIALFYGNEVML